MAPLQDPPLLTMRQVQSTERIVCSAHRSVARVTADDVLNWKSLALRSNHTGWWHLS